MDPKAFELSMLQKEVTELQALARHLVDALVSGQPADPYAVRQAQSFPASPLNVRFKAAPG